MKKFLGTAVILTSGIAFMTSAFSFGFGKDSDKKSFSSSQQQEIQKIVHDYLVANPEVLIEASQVLQNKEMAKAKSQAMKGITANKENLFSSPTSPTAGNMDGATIVVEFFDYQCSHCKEMQPTIEKVIGSNKAKLIFKEFPIFGDVSSYAAQMALAAVKQHKYLEFHNALMKNSGALSSAKVEEIAKSVGLNVDQLKKDINGADIKKELSDNFNLAKALNLAGTPSFVLSNKAMTAFDFIPGAAAAQQFQEAVDNIAKK